jgi:hypothetical protein
VGEDTLRVCFLGCASVGETRTQRADIPASVADGAARCVSTYNGAEAVEAGKEEGAEAGADAAQGL